MGAELPNETADVELPLRMHRLAMVPGQVQGGPASFILDTGGQVISISTDTASGLERGEMRNIPLKVYGASGWDRDAFLMPGVNLNFTNKIEYKNLSVVVLNLRAPSVLLGFRLGGIVGLQVPEPLSRGDQSRQEHRAAAGAAAAEETGELTGDY